MTPHDRLVCGAVVDDLIAQVADSHSAERTPHQDSCPHCQAALAEYQWLWSPIQDFTDEAVAVPDSILENVLRAIRGTGRDPHYGVLITPLGRTRIADRVVAVTAWITTEQIPGVRAAFSREITHHQATGGPTDHHGGDDTAGGAVEEAVAGTHGASTAVQITLAASYGQDLPALAGRIRATVTDRIRVLTGLYPAQITIIIDDVLDG